MTQPPPTDSRAMTTSKPAAPTATPKVMGILMIIFGGLGFVTQAGGKAIYIPSGMTLDAVSGLSTLVTVSTIGGYLVSGLHLVAGLKALKYRVDAPGFATAYGVAALGLAASMVILIVGWMDAYGTGAYGMIMLIGAALHCIWPVIVLVLMRLPGVRAACRR